MHRDAVKAHRKHTVPAPACRYSPATPACTAPRFATATS